MPYRMSTDNRLGVPDLQLYAVDTTPKVAIGTIIRAFDDTGVLGDGEFMYAQATVAVTAGQSVVFRNGPNNAVALTASGTHANTGRPVCVALTDIPAGSYGWFQIAGVAIVNVTAAAADGRVYITATPGALSNAAVAGAQVQDAVFNSAIGTPAAGKAYMQLSRPSMQTQIT